MLVFTAIMPHPPVSISGIGNPRELEALEKTLHSFGVLRQELEKSDPDTLIVISPHGNLKPYAFVVNSSDPLVGSFANFGLDQTYEFANNFSFANKLAYAGNMNEIPVEMQDGFLDHGSLIPLCHLLENINPKVVHLSFSLLGYQQQYAYGQVIRNLIDKGEGGRVAVVASADLSHKLTPSSPAGYSPGAQKFDQDIIHFLGSNDEANMLGLQPEATAEAAECGVRSILILLGILHGKKYEFDLLSYEFPFGIGYLTAKLV
ncbi:MAG: hypothetical protein ACD_56C00119G0011 [uncultured bacterium]|nr:MAG: hypothetical protein ACD_56C00119G0011 [uncultured bacterium]